MRYTNFGVVFIDCKNRSSCSLICDFCNVYELLVLIIYTREHCGYYEQCIEQNGCHPDRWRDNECHPGDIA